jgi:Uma2 family endonuclease
MGRFAKRGWEGRYTARMADRLPSVTVAKFSQLRHVGKRMTLAEFRALPEEKPYLELIDRVVEQKPVVSADHGRVAGQVDGWFFLYTRIHGGDFGPERNVTLDDDNEHLPDTAYWAPGVDSGDYSVPTVAVEVRSPGQSMPKLREKCRRYLPAGSSAAWLIDPKARTIEVFEAAGTRTLRAGETLTCDAMPGFELVLDEFFSFLDR